MNYEVVNLEAKKVVGITARTNNFSPEIGQVIGGMWSKFFEQGIYASIADKKDEKALGIYTDYQADENADYTVMVGCEVKQESDLSGDVILRTIPAGRYAKFVVVGDMYKAVAEFWEKLWEMDLPRAYTYDFEEYQDDKMDDAEIHIYIALTEE